MSKVTSAFIPALALFATGCKNLPPANEQYQERANKTVYRAADEDTREEPATVAPQPKVPGQ
jgi:starvation-inducible outer membrane lipoprotein